MVYIHTHLYVSTRLLYFFLRSIFCSFGFPFLLSQTFGLTAYGVVGSGCFHLFSTSLLYVSRFLWKWLLPVLALISIPIYPPRLLYRADIHHTTNDKRP